MMCIFRIQGFAMGIVNIDDELHDNLRRASGVSGRSINAQAGFWIKVGMLCEMNPGMSYQEIVNRELRAAGVDPGALRVAVA
jgi:plasmid stability protein